MKSGTFKFILLLLFLGAAVLVSLLREPQQEKPSSRFNVSRAFNPEKGVLVLDISSTISYQQQGPVSIGGASLWVSQIDKAAAQPGIKGILLRINSPGGTIVASQEVYEALQRFRETKKPLVVSIKDICASGAYYISLPANVIVANRGSLIGSIGVRIGYMDISKFLDKWGIESGDIVSAPYKDIFSITRSLTDFEKNYIQKTVQELHEIFVSDVIKWRSHKSSEQSLRTAANGLVYTSSEALRLGLIDEVGDLVAAKKMIASLIDEDYEDIKFIKPLPFSWF